MYYFDPKVEEAVLLCPSSEEVIAAYLDGRLFVEERERLEEHLAGCGACLTVLADSIRALLDNEALAA